MQNKKTIAIIPARGGSKRIPKKNIIEFHGKPLIAWTIEAALESKLFDRVLVSTDCKEIAEIAIQNGAEVPFLRKEFSDDYTPVSRATISSLEQAEAYWNEKFNIVIQLFACCPLRNSEDIKKAYAYFLKQRSSFLISAYKFEWVNPWWAVTLNNEFKPKRLFPEGYTKRSQDLPEIYGPTGAIWIANVDALKKSLSFYGESHIYFPIDWKAAIDVDDFEDLEMAKAIYIMNNNYG